MFFLVRKTDGDAMFRLTIKHGGYNARHLAFIDKRLQAFLERGEANVVGVGDRNEEG
jgi:hypothetical protein